MQSRDISFGEKKATGLEMDLPNARLVLASGKRGFVMCGYLNLEAAENLKDAAAVVTGVKTIDELLEKKVVRVSSQAKRLGVRIGMSGREALKKFL